jgi:autotransporter-associated beta strand protein
MKRARTPFRPRLEELESRLLLAQRVWDGRPDGGGTSVNNKWLTATNWVGDVAPSPGDDLVFAPGAANLTNINDFPIGTGFGTVTFSGTGYNVLSSNSISLGGGGIKATNASGSNTFGLSFGVPATISPTRSLEVTNAGAELRLTGNISQNATLFKDGDGKLTLSGNSTFTGAMNVDDGTLAVASDNALGSAAAITRVKTGATLRVEGTTTAAGIAETIRLDGGATLQGATGIFAALAGDILLAGSAFIQVEANGTLDVSGGLFDVVAGSPGGFSKRGTGTLTLHGAGSYTGLTTVEEGSVSIADGAALGATGAGAGTTVRAGASLSGFSTITVNEALTLDGDTGPGTDRAALTSAGALTWGGPITLAGNAALFTYSIFGGSTTMTVTGSIGGSGDLFLDAAFLSFSTSLVIGGSGASTYSGTTTVESGIVELRKPTGVIAVPGPLTVGTGSLGGKLVLNGSTSTAGSNQIASSAAVTINDGALDLNGRSNTIASLTMTGGTVTTASAGTTIVGTLALGGDVTATSDADGNFARIDGSLSLGPANRTFTVTQGQSGQELVVTAVVSGGTFVGLTKDGNGDMALTGANTYSGLTDIAAGTLTAGSTTALGAGFSAGNLGTTNALRSTIIESGAHLILGQPIGTAINEQITISATPGGVTERAILNTDLQSRTISGPIFLSGSASVDGTGQMTLSGPVTEVSAGTELIKVGNVTLVLGGASTLSGGLLLRGGAMLVNGDADGSPVSVETPTTQSTADSVLAGTGDVGSTGVSDGSIDPGPTAGSGTLTVHGALSFTDPPGAGDARAFHVDLTRPVTFVPAIGDQLVVFGAVDLGNGITALDITLRGHAPALNQSFVIIANDGTDAVTGAFVGVQEGVLFSVDGSIYSLTYHGGSGNNDVVLTYLDTPAMISDVSLTAAPGKSGHVNFSGQLVDPDDADARQLTLTLDWGDDSPVQVVHPGTDSFRLKHRYRKAGTYTVRFTWTDGHGVVRSDTRAVTVSAGQDDGDERDN